MSVETLPEPHPGEALQGDVPLEGDALFGAPKLPKLHVAVANRADGGIAYWLGKLFGFAALIGVACDRAPVLVPVQLLLAAHAADPRT